MIKTSYTYRMIRKFHEWLVFRFASRKAAFTSIWRYNYWGSEESLSGPGSTLNYTREIREKMPRMFREMGIRSVFDAPCGDFHWMRHMLAESNVTYIGGDIVSELININKERFESQNIKFIECDITSDKFPDVDLWLCRAALYHLSNQDIYKSLERFVESKIKYMLTTSHTTSQAHINTDIMTGDWRLLNLRLPPFNLPRESLFEIDDYVPPHPAATLLLWTRIQVEDSLLNMRIR